MEAKSLSTEAPQCPGCLARDREIAGLRAQLARLSARVEALERGSKRQAAPFSKGEPKPNPKASCNNN